MCRSKRLVALIASALFASSAFAGEPTHVAINELAKSAVRFVGKSVTTHGCLVKHFHGSFVQPCGTQYRRGLVLVLDPDYKVPAVFRQLGVDYSSEVQGDFSGVIVEVDIPNPKPHKKPFLRLDSVVNAKPYEP